MEQNTYKALQSCFWGIDYANDHIPQVCTKSWTDEIETSEFVDFDFEYSYEQTFQKKVRAKK